MIACASIWAVVLRHARVLKRDINALLFTLYWPALDIFVWGYLGMWIQAHRVEAMHNYQAIALLGILLWQVVGRGSNVGISVLTEELWAGNMVNLFSLPLRIVEWMIGAIIVYFIMMVFTSAASMAVIYILYRSSLGLILSNFFIFAPPLFLSGISLLFIASQVIIMFGRGGIEIGYIFGWFFLPFSGAYYPIDVLPSWGQKIGSFLPMSYVFQGMRESLMYQRDPTPYLIKGYALSIFYVIISLLLFVYFFNRSKKKGLARLAEL